MDQTRVTMPAARTAAELKKAVAAALAELKRRSSRKVRDGMVRFGLPNDQALGVGMADIQKLGKKLHPDHDLAEALWRTGVYEARLLAVYVDDPGFVTPRQMDRWCRDFDNWGIVDTVCFKLFDQVPHAWKKIAPWSKAKGEFQKRAGVVLIACLAGHDREAKDEGFRRCLPIIAAAAEDERNFVKKGVSWALRMVGRRNSELNVAALKLAQRLIDSKSPAARWVGRDAFRELTSPAVKKRIAGM